MEETKVVSLNLQQREAQKTADERSKKLKADAKKLTSGISPTFEIAPLGVPVRMIYTAYPPATITAAAKATSVTLPTITGTRW